MFDFLGLFLLLVKMTLIIWKNILLVEWVIAERLRLHQKLLLKNSDNLFSFEFNYLNDNLRNF